MKQLFRFVVAMGLCCRRSSIGDVTPVSSRLPGYSWALVSALLLSGCGTLGTSSRGATRDGRLPFVKAPDAGQDSFRQQVQNDPFPAATDVCTSNMQVQVHQ